MESFEEFWKENAYNFHPDNFLSQVKQIAKNAFDAGRSNAFDQIRQEMEVVKKIEKEKSE